MVSFVLTSYTGIKKPPFSLFSDAHFIGRLNITASLIPPSRTILLRPPAAWFVASEPFRLREFYSKPLSGLPSAHGCVGASTIGPSHRLHGGRHHSEAQTISSGNSTPVWYSFTSMPSFTSIHLQSTYGGEKVQSTCHVWAHRASYTKFEVVDWKRVVHDCTRDACICNSGDAVEREHTYLRERQNFQETKTLSGPVR